MVRGRKRDVGAPLTRSLVLQRDYRARKAQYVSDLETRCHKLERDNNKLFKEVEDLKSKLLQKEIDCKEMLASLTTKAELEKAHALYNVMSSLSSAATSIKSFQNLTMGPNQSNSEGSLVERKSSLGAQGSSPSTTPSNSSVHSDLTELSSDNLCPLQLCSPQSSASRSRSLSLSSSQHGGHDDWRDIPPGFIAQGIPDDADREMDVPSTHSSHNMRPDVQTAAYPPSRGRELLIGFSTTSQSFLSPGPLSRGSLSLPFLEDNYRHGRSSHPASNRSHGSTNQMVSLTSNVVLQDHPIASYERTLSQSLRNWL